MKQALNIFRKDVRRLWLPVVISLAGVAGFVWVEAGQIPAPLHYGTLLSTVIFAGWLYLIARLVHEESLPGDTQFWLSRPYSRFSLCAAKLCFAAVFVVLPFFIGSIVILKSCGFEVLPQIPGLLAKLFYLAAVVWLPAFALAAVTNRLSNFTLGTFLVFGALAVAAQIYGRPGVLTPGQVSWIPEAIAQLILFLGAAGVAIWQYRTRKTNLGILLFAGFLLATATGFFLSPDAAFAINTAVQPASPQQVALSVSREGIVESPFTNRKAWAREFYVVSFPYRVAGVPPNMEVHADAASFRVTAADRSPISVFANQGIYTVGGITIDLTPAQFDLVGNRPVSISGTLWLTLIQPQNSQQAAFGRPVTLPGGTRCHSSRDHTGAWIRCTTPLRSRQRIGISLLSRPGGERIDHQVIARLGTYSPLPADFGFSPVHRAYSFHPMWVLQSLTDVGGKPSTVRKQIEDFDVEYEVAKPVAHLRRDFVIDKVVLSNLPQPPESR